MSTGSRSSQPSGKKIDLYEDMLSSLPDNVIQDNILSRLSPRDAVRTSVLARFWRYKWTYLTHVFFDYQSFPRCKNQSPIEHDRKLVTFVDQFLLLHQGPIHAFSVCADSTRSEIIDRWVIFLSRNDIKIFRVLKISGPKYFVHSCLYNCDITCLHLQGCILVPPASFNGFRNLLKLNLRSVRISDEGLDCLISSCPLLKDLRLFNIDGCTHLNICAPKLVILHVKGAFTGLSFEKTKYIAEVYIKLLNADGESQGTTGRSTCKIEKVLGCFTRTARLKLLGDTIQILSAADVPVSLPTECYHLSYLSLALELEEVQEILTALCIFRSSPVLQKVEIKSIYREYSMDMLSVEDFWKSQNDFCCQFSQLQILNFKEFYGSTSELKVVEFVLANAPVLKTVNINMVENAVDMVTVLKKCNGFMRRSSKAVIVFPE